MSEHNHHHDHDNESKQEQARDNRYWLSLEQYNNDPDFQKNMEHEFLSSPLREESENEGKGVWARREFLKLMGASVAMASAGCIRRPVQKIIPYVQQPTEITLGKWNIYSSSWFDGNESYGLLVRTREGRPLKVEGNPLHPLSKGGLSARAQAHILSLYDPDRLTGPRRNLQREGRTNHETVNVSWDKLDSMVADQLKKGGVALLTGQSASPATRSLVSDFAQATGASHTTWQPLSFEDVAQGQKLSYGSAVVPTLQIDKAKVIVSIDADFLGAWGTPTAWARQFADARRNPEKMNRLYVFDSNYSLTGANADLRFKIKPSQQLDVVMGLLHEIVVSKGQTRYATDSRLKEALKAFSGVAQKLGIDEAMFVQLATDLLQARGESLVLAGGLPTGTAMAHKLQAAVNLLNSALDNDGKTVSYGQPMQGLGSSQEAIRKLVADMNSKKVKTLIIHGVNPAYSLPTELGFADALKNVESIVCCGDRVDETAWYADFVAADNHPMESWADNETVAGSWSVQQPTIQPLHDTRSFQESLLAWAQKSGKASARLKAKEFYEYLRNYCRDQVFAKYGKGSFEDFWQEILQKGSIDRLSAAANQARSARADALYDLKPANQSGYELVLYPTVQLGDGSLANISWLQELPDPVTKIVWDNYASISMATSEKLKAKEGDLLKVKVGAKEVTLPAHIQPGLHDDVVAVAVGYGRTRAGKVGNNVGTNAFGLMAVGDVAIVSSGLTVDLQNTGKKYELANVQGHHSMEGRAIVNEATLNDYKKDKEAGIHRHKIFSIWPEHKYEGHKWGMTVDLNLCNGCSACMVACQSENNIPVVGKKYVLQGREMHWIRLDRYYTGNPENAETVFQPVMCQHCDNAPCETVCPVLATVHSSEGLNEMVYNRCVGTRYCSNNCPYKVRRFNWFNFNKDLQKPMDLAKNPDVMVRMRGVMEKCSFCVQRIKDGKETAKAENRKLQDGEIKTACQQSCPTQAIIFGDLNDKESAVAQAFHKEPRAYALLEEFHAAPAVRYLTKIRNNHKETTKDSHGGQH